MNKVGIVGVTFILVAIGIFGGSWYWLSTESIRDGYHPRELSLFQSLNGMVACLVVGEREGVFQIPREELGKNLNSKALRNCFQTSEICEQFVPLTAEVNERNKLERDYILFDESKGLYVDEMDNPIFIIFFGDKMESYADRELNRLARRYRAAAWIVGEDGVNRYGRSADGFFVGYTRDDGKREGTRYVAPWWKFWR